jgi:hypothetical protein
MQEKVGTFQSGLNHTMCHYANTHSNDCNDFVNDALDLIQSKDTVYLTYHTGETELHIIDYQETHNRPPRYQQRLHPASSSYLDRTPKNIPGC